MPTITEIKECEVSLRFTVPKDKMKHIYEATKALAKVGISFDTGGSITDPVDYDWEFDWSLKGPVKVLFKRFREKVEETNAVD